MVYAFFRGTLLKNIIVLNTGEGYCMSEFSDLLKEYLAVKNKNVISMAKFCNTDKSTMYKFLKASRNPTSEDLVRKMAGYLQLTPDEEEKFMEAYQIALNGRVTYYRRKEVERFISDPLISPETSDSFQLNKEKMEPFHIRMFDHPHAVVRNLYETVLAEGEKENGYLSVYLTDADERFSQFISSFLQNHPGISLDLVLMINDDSYEYSREDSGYLNLKKLKCVMPLAVRTENRRFFYQYGTVSAAADKNLPYFTNILLTSDTVILMGNGHMRSMCIRDPEVCAQYKKIFADALVVSRKLVVTASAPEQMFGYLSSLSFSGLTAKMIFESCPCFFKDVTEELLKDTVIEEIPMREELIRQVLAYTEYNRSVIKSGKVTMIHCFDGYRDFMENGLLRDIPTWMYRPLSMKERIEMLERYIASIGKSDLHVLKKAIGPVENGFYIFLYDNSLMFQFLDSEGKLMIIQMDEFSYYEAFTDYLESLLERKELFYTKEELKKKLNELLQEYRNQIK